MRGQKEPDNYRRQREEMVAGQIEARGIRDRRLLEAMREIPRHLFVPAAYRGRAYDDCPLPITEGQTISQPYMVASMTELLELTGGELVLEVGTGSGYQAAILGRLARFVYTVEYIPALAESAREILDRLGFTNIEVVVGDGSKGLPGHAPYDRIIVTAGAPDVPQPLVDQLADGGRLVIPVGSTGIQVLKVVIREGPRTVTRDEGGCVFVPLVGMYGWER